MRVACRDLGLTDYAACWQLQQRLFDALIARKTSAEEDSDRAGIVLLTEHRPVYTLGKSGHAANLLVDSARLEALGAQFFHIDRGGDITFHGPGQLVCYPILDLERIGIGLRLYIDALEEAVIRTVARYGIRAGRIPGASGVWIGGAATREGDEETQHLEGDKEKEAQHREGDEAKEAQHREGAEPDKVPSREGFGPDRTQRRGLADAPRKICAIGVRSSRYVTMHGFALNVTTDLGWFANINPCGFSDRGVTSIAAETGREVPMEEVKRAVMEHLSEILNVKIYKY